MRAERLSLRVVCADTSAFLKLLSDSNIFVYDVSRIEELVITFSVDGKYYDKVCTIAQKRGATLSVVKRRGWLPALRAVRKRVILQLSILCLLLLSLWLPTRVLFIRVEGNILVDEKAILNAAEGCGLHFGVSRRALRSEVIKNHLLKELPQLQWAGVNTTGCTAVIHVRETALTAEPEQSSKGQMYALCDGIVLEATVTSGYTSVAVGQAVKAGQLLVNDRQDESFLSPQTEVNAEIFALTLRRITVAVPAISVQKLYTEEKNRNYALLLGKNRIKLSKYSGILPTGCVKMYEQMYTHLPGGFALPLGVEIESQQSYVSVEIPLSESEVLRFAEDSARSCLEEQMIAGRILSCRGQIVERSDFALVDFEFQCVEMIGRIYDKENR